MRTLATQTRHLVVHFAPPCASFSRARDRALRTKLRSKKHPGGLPSKRDNCEGPNLIVKKCFKLAIWAADTLGAKVSIENPVGSYMWAYAETLLHEDACGKLPLDAVRSKWADVDLDTCRFGAPYKKSTRLRVWGWHPPQIGQ